MDGCAKGNLGRIGIGNLLRGDNGQWLIGFISVTDNLLPDLVAICHGLVLTWDKGYRRVCYEGDSKEAIRLILSKNCHSHVYQSMIVDIQHWLCRSWEVELTHVLREANSYTNFLANEGSRVDDVVIVLDQPPPNLRALLAADYMETYSLRY